MNEPQFLYLTTVGWKTGKKHRIEIWYVKRNRKYYVMSELRASAHWIRNISHNPRISFIVNGLNFIGHARIVNPMKETRLAAEVSELMKVKYKWDQGLIVELKSLDFDERQLRS
jgi:F420H(2)-dependent quinone reductase